MHFTKPYIISLLIVITLPTMLFGKDTPLRYNLHIRPILSDRCFVCHGFDKHGRKADLRLDIAEHAYAPLTKGEGFALVPGKPDASVVWQRITTSNRDKIMPPNDSLHRLSANEKSLIKQWITEGAKYEPHWSFVIPTRPEVPKTPTTHGLKWGNNPIDQFVLSRMQQAHLSPAPCADKRTLIRRVYLDMIGLPPTIAQVDAYINDKSDTAYEKVVDQLLASDHYGERQALPWLDAARYADSNGFQGDGDRFAYPWRDWLIKALNNNKPFDQFTIEMLAGDLLEEPTTEQLIATSFNRNTMSNGEGGAIAEESRFNYVIDRIHTTATTFLGLTIACAQCHDHKFDPFTQKEFYQFSAFFDNINDTKQLQINTDYHKYIMFNPTLKLPGNDEIDKKLIVAENALKKIGKENLIINALTSWCKKLSEEDVNRYPKEIIPYIKDIRVTDNAKISKRKLQQWYVEHISKDPKHKSFLKLIGEIHALREQIPYVLIMKELEGKKKRKTVVHPTGLYDDISDQEVFGGIPAVLGTLPAGNANRLSLATWIVSPKNPLTARVIINRYWQGFFGRGIVKTPEDFGAQGAWPSHPLLLDWLAIAFQESKWNVKHIHKLIVTSATYKQDSHFEDEKHAIDPENIFLARGKRSQTTWPPR